MGIASDLYRASALNDLKTLMRDLGVRLNDYEETMDQAMELNPKAAKVLESQLISLGLIGSDGALSKEHLKKFNKAVEYYEFQQQRVFGKWFMGLGEKAKEVYENTKGLLAAGFSLHKVEELIGLSTQEMRATIQGTGELNHSTTDALGNILPFTSLTAVVEGTAMKYGYDSGEVQGLTENFARLFGTDKKVAERSFESMFAYARMTGKDIREVYNFVEANVRNSGTTVEDATNDLLDTLLQSEAVNKNLDDVTSSLLDTPGHGAVWRKDFLSAVVESQEEMGSPLVPEPHLLAELMTASFQEARKLARSYKEMVNISKGYTKLIHGPSYVQFHYGITIFEMMDAEVKKQTVGMTEAQAEVVTKQVIAKYSGEHFVDQSYQIFKAMKNGDRMMAPMAMMELAKGSKLGMAKAIEGTVGHMKATGSTAAIASIMEMGLTRTEAIMMMSGIQAGQTETMLENFSGEKASAESSSLTEEEKERARGLVKRAPLGIAGQILDPIATYLKHPLLTVATGAALLAAGSLKQTFNTLMVSKSWLRIGRNYQRAASTIATGGMSEGPSAIASGKPNFFKGPDGKMRWGRVAGVSAAAITTGTLVYNVMASRKAEETKEVKLEEASDREVKVTIERELKEVERRDRKESPAPKTVVQKEQKSPRSPSRPEIDQQQQSNLPREQKAKPAPTSNEETTVEQKIAKVSKDIEQHRPKKRETPQSKIVPEERTVTTADIRREISKKAGNSPKASRVINYLTSTMNPTEDGLKSVLLQEKPLTHPLPITTEKVATELVKQDNLQRESRAVDATYHAMGGKVVFDKKTGKKTVEVRVPRFVNTVTKPT